MISYKYNNINELHNFIDNNFSNNDKYDVLILFSKKNELKLKDIIYELDYSNVNFKISNDELLINGTDIILVFKKNTLKELKKMALLGDMIANISHQWRQPLSVITSSASAMILHKNLDILDDKSFLKFANNIITQGYFLAQTIDTFRSYIKKDNTVLDVIVQDEINTTLKILDAVFSQNYINVINNISKTKNISMRLIKGEFSQVLINIITNAKDVFLSNNIQNKEIIINLKEKDNKCIICIEDNAGGIHKDIIDKIFDEDFTTKQNNGTGIGLSMSYEIVKEHLNGDLYVQNTKKGAKFFIELPITTKQLV